MSAYVVPPHFKPVSLLKTIEASSSSQKEQGLDLNWEPFQAHIEAFLRAIDNYATDAKVEIAARATEHNEAVRDLKAGKEEMDRRINLERERETAMLAAIEAERQSMTNLTSAVSHLQLTLSKARDQSSLIESELNSVKKETLFEKSEKERQKSKLDEQIRTDDIEIETLEDILGVQIRGVGNDCIWIKFRLIDVMDLEREFGLILDVGKHDYEVTRCDPIIPNLSELLSDLNEDRHFSRFIKRVRKAFKALVPEPPKPASKFDDLNGPGMRTPGQKRTLDQLES